MKTNKQELCAMHGTDVTCSNCEKEPTEKTKEIQRQTLTAILPTINDSDDQIARKFKTILRQYIIDKSKEELNIII